jgi:hypothetical protein
MDAGESGASPAVALEVGAPVTARPFASGIVLGIAIAMTGIHAYLVVSLATYRTFYREMNPEVVPPATWIVTSPLWSVTVPVVAGAAIAVLIWRRPRALWPYLAIAAALVVTLGVTWWFYNAPMRALADGIQ